MFEKLKKIKNFRKKLREKDLFRFDIKTTRPLIDRINALNFETLGNEEFEEMSRKLACEWKGEIQQEDLLVKAFALAKEAAKRVLGVCPYDVQLMAGIAMLNGNVAQMQTGEGKTLAAVFPAYLNALSGKGVHILTFNDYLAKRDSEWMGPVYDLLGLTVGYINEGMTQEQRKRAYQCDITYATAKEAGFDFLRGFLSMKKEELTQREFNVAIIDEADSILIDEGRIPLVIAGDVGGAESEARRASDIVRSLRRGIHYAKDEYERNVYLTDRGVEVVENMLECGNLYDEENLELLTGINSALHAHVLLKRNVDYIVRNGIVELVDEFTGRVAENRKWPDGLQNAIEAKEGLTGRNTGQIMYSITMQNFIRQYPKICGMTGTAYSAAEEFRDFYGIGVAIIPTHRPCIRVDEPDVVFTHKEAKYKALVKEILRVHKTGRPILIGTCSVDESERIFSELKEAGVNCQVLNAKNDELEAAIIERAGTFGAVTVSTNMAGRGTDIKLGMGDGDEHYKVAVLGGLYVIGTNRHESIRIDNQLRGRAGRQGDPGSTRFFISLEDDLLVKYKITSLIPEKFYPKKQDTPLNDPMIESEIARAQRIIEGQNFDTRKALCKYSIILDEQRRIIHKKRREILLNLCEAELFKERLGERYEKLVGTIGPKGPAEAERRVKLYHINRCWAEYLSYISYVRESIHLYNLGGKVPLDEFNIIAVKAFEDLLKNIDDSVVETLGTADIKAGGIDMEKEGLKSPSATWTYMVDDGAEQFGIMPALSNPIVAASSPIIYSIMALFKSYKNKNVKEIK